MNSEITIKSGTDMFIKADEVSKTLDVSMTYAYRVIKQLNEELFNKGYLTVSGKTSRKYFYERIYTKMY